MKKIILAIDSFKGSLTSTEAETAAQEGINRIDPTIQTICIPIADGGEGMLDALPSAGYQEMKLRVQGPLKEEVTARYLISQDGQTAYIEMASASGLTLVHESQRNPMLTTTYGTGELMRDALDRGCRHLVIGLGGSATNDAGMGMLQALGVRFLDENGTELPGRGKELAKVAHIDTTGIHPALKLTRCTAACDVRNPFYGPNGAAYVFAPQKGADSHEVQLLDQGMIHLAKLIKQTTGEDITHLPGAGAAGGLGGTLAAFLHAELRPGIDIVLEANRFHEYIQQADFIITGEGKADRQTLMGKVAIGVLQEGKRAKKPVILIAGRIEDEHPLYEAGFYRIYEITPSSMSPQEAMRKETAKENIRRTMEIILSEYDNGNYQR